MNKNLRYLVLLPLYGSIILLFYLFIKMIRQELSKKKFYNYFFKCGFFGFLIILISFLLINLINYLFDLTLFSGMVSIVIVFILAGYVFNLFVFFQFYKHWIDK